LFELTFAFQINPNTNGANFPQYSVQDAQMPPVPWLPSQVIDQFKKLNYCAFLKNKTKNPNNSNNKKKQHSTNNKSIQTLSISIFSETQK